MNNFIPSIDYVSIKTNDVNFLEQLISFLSGRMPVPTAYGWFHLIGIALIIIACVLAFRFSQKIDEKKMNLILGITAAVMVVLEIYKQLTYSYNATTDTWDYQWYVFPFQFCATPMYTLMIIPFLKEGKFKNSLYSYLATYGLFGGLVVILYPTDIFTIVIGVNIHGLAHHGAMAAIGIILYGTGRVELSHKTILRALPVFATFLSVAMIGNILYGELLLPITGETCNLFFISPYFPCTLPVLNMFYGKVPYLVFLLIYVIGFTAAAYIMSLLAMGINKLYKLIREKLLPKQKEKITTEPTV